MFGKTSLASSSDLWFSATNYANCIYAFSVVLYSTDWATEMASEPQKVPFKPFKPLPKVFLWKTFVVPA